MCDKTRKDKIKMSAFTSIMVASIGEKLGETRLRWLGHVQSKPTTMPVRKNLSMQVVPPQAKRLKRT